MLQFLFIICTLFLISNVLFLIIIQYFKKKSYIDEIMGLYNFRYLKLYLRKKTKKHQVGVVIIDINDFKKFNEQSISKGDEVLIEFSIELTNIIISKATLFRYRIGDEFALVFCNKNTEEILNEITNIKSYFENYSFRCLPLEKDYRIEFCYGMTEIKKNIANFDKIFEIAELELASQKKSLKGLNF